MLGQPGGRLIAGVTDFPGPDKNELAPVNKKGA
jgi:hypothetical protein